MNASNYLLLLILTLQLVFILSAPEYNIGTGIYDVTGPAEGVTLMGYGMLQQRSKGIINRLYARAFIIEHAATKKRIVFVNLDAGIPSQAVTQEVVKLLKEKYDGLYTEHNVMISAMHTHSGPGGTSHYIVYNIPSLGFERNNFDQMVNGIFSAINAAHANMRPGKIKINRGKLYNANINRSPTSYLHNPEEERKQYPDGDTNKDHTILRFEDEYGNELGMLSWFSVHPTSVNNTNLLITSDNKGYAAYLFEKLKNGDVLPGKGPFIAGFCMTAAGDASPNIMGAFCPDGKPCDNDSTCGGKSALCIGRGPGNDMYESCAIIGRRQFESALELYNEAKRELKGPIDFRHTFVNMHNITVDAKYTSTGKNERTCRGALGFSFAAGTTDGPGGWFKQGLNESSNPFIRFLLSFIKKPTKDQIECQKPKQILLDVGGDQPYLWTPDVLPIQIFRIGQFVLLGFPGEITTMAGRRLEKHIYQRLRAYNIIGEDGIVLIASHANAYSQYVSTFEEYRVQRYEAASTLYGPHTLSAYIQEFDKLAIALATGKPVPPGPKPANTSHAQKSFNPGVVLDSHPGGKPFGYVHLQPNSEYKTGDVVNVEFWSGNLRNHFMTQDSFVFVEKQVGDKWVTIETDASFFITEISWKRVWNGIFPCARVTVLWRITKNTQSAKYRIRHVGYAKPSATSNEIVRYEGVTNEFAVIQ